MSSSSGNQPKTRSDLVASVKLPPSVFAKGWLSLQRFDTWVRLGLCFLAGLVMWFITGGWSPPLGYRESDVPERDVVTRTVFRVEDPKETLRLQERTRRNIKCVYINDPRLFLDLQQALKDKLFQVARASSLSEVDPELWRTLTTLPAPAQPIAGEDLVTRASRWGSLSVAPFPIPLDVTLTYRDLQELEFLALRELLSDPARLDRLEGDVRQALAPLQRDGLLASIQHDEELGVLTQIQVYDVGKPDDVREVWVQDVLLGDATVRLKQSLQTAIQSPLLAQAVYNWLKPRLVSTLSLDAKATSAVALDAAAKVPTMYVTYEPGDVLAHGGEPIQIEQLTLLQAEHQAMLSSMRFSQRARYGLAKAGMFVAFFVLCGWYLFVRARGLLNNTLTLSRILLLAVLTTTLAVFAYGVHAELVPLLLFSMTMVIAYQQELALLFSAAMALTAVLTLGLGINELVITFASMAVSVLLLRQIRHRTRLLYVSLVAAAVGGLTTLGVYGLHSGSELPIWQDPATLAYLVNAGYFMFLSALAGLIMTGLLPFIERGFDVQTELSLLELGDVAHPLLQELVRRAPGTFNHSMNVASIAEAAAEAIGANGLLVRVGAYFHDIGKMLKPSYFVENQPRDENRHESLLPAMSTLIIIAHVKDGADLARQHNLPNSIIDFIRQHHGTTLVEYFYHRASEQSGQDPDGSRVEEGTYRYPGPKPRTKEAAVLMLSDAVEGAGRTLADPTPAKIEGLVHDLAMKRLLDGQFDECGLTLRELRRIELSLIKSLSAICHGRIRYPDQQTA